MNNTTDRPDSPVAAAPASLAAPHRPRWHWPLVIIGPVVALLVANFATAGLAMLLLPNLNEAELGTGQVLALVIGQSVVVCAVVIGLCALLLKAHGLRLRDAGLRWTGASAPSLLLGVGVAVAVVLAVGLPLHALGLLRPAEDLGLPVWALLVAGLFQALVLQGFPEELLFRGYQMTALRVSPVAAVLVSSLVFGVIHVISSGGQQNALERVLYLATPFGFAVTAGALVILTRSLWAAVGVHAGLHLGTIAGLLMGVGNGPWLWVLTGAVFTLVGALLLVLAHRRGLLAGTWTGPTR